MNWQVEWLDEAKKDMRKLGKAEQIQGNRESSHKPTAHLARRVWQTVTQCRTNETFQALQNQIQGYRHSRCLQTVTAKWNHDHHRRWHSFR
jgi:hypothetical protein